MKPLGSKRKVAHIATAKGAHCTGPIQTSISFGSAAATAKITTSMSAVATSKTFGQILAVAVSSQRSRSSSIMQHVSLR